MDADHQHQHHAAQHAHYTLYDTHDHWASTPGLFYAPEHASFMPPPLPLSLPAASQLALQQPPHSPVTPDASTSGVLTRQRARQQMLVQQQQTHPPSPQTLSYASPAEFQSLNAMFTGHHHFAQPSGAFHHSPPFPSTPVSSAPSSRATYYSAGRSASPALSVASTSLTSLSGGHQQHHPYLSHRAMSPECAPPTPATGHPSASASGTPDVSDTPSGLLLDPPSDINSEGIEPSSGPRRQRKSRLNNLDRKAICCFARAHPEMRQEEVAARYGVERSTISKILKQKDKWMAVQEADDLEIVKHRPSKFPTLEKRLMIILKQATRDKTPLTDLFIRIKAKEVAKEIGISEDKFKASSGWVENFKHRHNVRRGVLVGRSAARLRKHGSDGELTGDEESDWEDRVLPGEEDMSREERLAHRAAKKAERVALFRVAEEHVMQEHGEQVEAGLIDEELRMELILGRRAQLLRAKRENKSLDQLDRENEIIPEIVHSRLEADILANTGPNQGKRRAFVIVPAPNAASGVTPYGSQASTSYSPSLQRTDQATFYDASIGLAAAAQTSPTALPQNGFAHHGAQEAYVHMSAMPPPDAFTDVSAAIDFIGNRADLMLTQEERDALFALRQRVAQRTASSGVAAASM